MTFVVECSSLWSMNLERLTNCWLIIKTKNFIYLFFSMSRINKKSENKVPANKKMEMVAIVSLDKIWKATW